MEESVLLGTKPLVDSIRHFIRDPSGVFSVCHLCECRIVQWRHDSRLLLLLNWFLHIIKRTLHVSSKIWILCSSHHRVISSIYEAKRAMQNLCGDLNLEIIFLLVCLRWLQVNYEPIYNYYFSNVLVSHQKWPDNSWFWKCISSITLAFNWITEIYFEALIWW